jgi:hypothetical protein
MNIGDKVYIINTGNKYEDYILAGKAATIVNIYGISNSNYALRVDGIRNKASKDGLFYLKSYNITSCLCIEMPSMTFETYIMDDLTSTRRLVQEKELKSIVPNIFGIKKVIFNNPATIVIWSDNTKTIVKKQKGDRWDKEKGLAMCIVKKLFGNTGKYYEIFKEHL